MKYKLLTCLILGICLPGVLCAQEEIVGGSNYGQGNLVPQLAATAGWNGGALVLGLEPSVDILFYKPVVGSTAFIDIGLAPIGHIGLNLGSVAPGLEAGAGVQVAFHAGFRGFDFPGSEYLAQIDFFARAGVGYNLLSPAGAGLVFVASSGANYFLTPDLYVGVGYNQWGSTSGFSLQGGLRLGNPPAAVGSLAGTWAEAREVGVSAAQSAIMASFYAYYFMSFYTGGHFLQANFTPGQGVVWQVTDGDSDRFSIERAFLSQESDGTQWWRLKYFTDDEAITWEFRINREAKVLELWYKIDEGEAVRIVPSGDSYAAYYEGTEITDSLLAQSTRKEQIRVGAGAFNADVVEMSGQDDEGSDYNYRWWLASTVPGGIVRFQARTGDDSFTMELVRVTTNNSAQLRR